MVWAAQLETECNDQVSKRRVQSRCFIMYCSGVTPLHSLSSVPRYGFTKHMGPGAPAGAGGRAGAPGAPGRGRGADRRGSRRYRARPRSPRDAQQVKPAQHARAPHALSPAPLRTRVREYVTEVREAILTDGPQRRSQGLLGLFRGTALPWRQRRRPRRCASVW